MHTPHYILSQVILKLEHCLILIVEKFKSGFQLNDTWTHTALHPLAVKVLGIWFVVIK